MRLSLTVVFIALGLISYAQSNTCVDCTLIDPNALCPLLYDPVCGCDGYTYSNECVAQSTAGVLYWTAGECGANNVSTCSDLAGINLGDCEQLLGFAIVNGECQAISGCSTVDSLGVDYAGALSPDMQTCVATCNCGDINNGVNEYASVAVRLQSDMAAGLLYLYYDLPSEARVTVFDLAGKQVLETAHLTGEAVDTSTLDHGIYLLRLTHKQREVWSGKLQFQH